MPLGAGRQMGHSLCSYIRLGRSETPNCVTYDVCQWLRCGASCAWRGVWGDERGYRSVGLLLRSRTMCMMRVMSRNGVVTDRQCQLHRTAKLHRRIRIATKHTDNALNIMSHWGPKSHRSLPASASLGSGAVIAACLSPGLVGISGLFKVDGVKRPVDEGNRPLTIAITTTSNSNRAFTARTPSLFTLASAATGSMIDHSPLSTRVRPCLAPSSDPARLLVPWDASPRHRVRVIPFLEKSRPQVLADDIHLLEWYCFVFLHGYHQRTMVTLSSVFPLNGEGT